MAIGAANGFNRPNPQTVKTGLIPAPIKGIDSRSPIGNMGPENCIYAFNIMPAETGMILRKGFREHQVAAVSVASEGFRSMIVFNGLTESLADDRLYGVTNEGIWDVTVDGAAPVLKFSLPSTANDAGYGVSISYVDQAGAIFILYSDFENGLIVYTQSTDTWAVAVPGDYTGGIVTTEVVFVVVHKQRLWMILKNEAQAYYLPVASIKGAGTAFFFGTKFPSGGTLAALINWSVDGGHGVDDYLVAVSSTGDVIPYEGADPSVAEGAGLAGWAARGTYFVGKVPVGRKFFSEYSGSMYLLSSYGLISMSDLLRGVDVKDIADNSMAFPVAKLLRADLAQSSDIMGWQPIFLPSQGQLTITSPRNPFSGNYIQYGMNLATEGWGLWRGVPIDCIAEWEGVTYFGNGDSNVFSMDVFRDNVLLDKTQPLSPGSNIQFSILTSYSHVNAPGIFKIAQLVRADFISAAVPLYEARVFYDYDIAELAQPIFAGSLLSAGIWDISLWDAALWVGELKGFNSLDGVAGGPGRVMAVAMRGEAGEETRLISWDIMWTQGWPL